MPRRNCNAKVLRVDIDRLAADAQDLATELTFPRTCAPACTACRANPATEGNYCLLCKGQLTLSARNNAIRR